MSMNKKLQFLTVLYSGISGAISFFISGLLATILIIITDQYLLAIPLSGLLGGLLLAIFNRNWKSIGRFTLAGVIAVSVGFLGTFIICEGIFSLIGMLTDVFSGRLENIISIGLMGVVFGIIFSLIVYGKKALVLFAVVCGIIELPCIYLVETIYLIKPLENLISKYGLVDINLLFIVLGFGIGAGVSIGLFKISAKDEINLQSSDGSPKDVSTIDEDAR